jgi:hypothetical protein
MPIREKLKRLVTETPFFESVEQGRNCQQNWMPSCIAKAACPGNGSQLANSCATPIANQ